MLNRLLPAAAAAAAILLFGCANQGASTKAGPATASSEPAPKASTPPRYQPPADPYPSTYRPYPGVPTAITGATVYDGEGGRIENGTVVMVDGRIQAVGGPDTPSKVTVSFDLPSREAVDEIVERARAAGGRIGDTDDYPFMYQRQFDDPDGYHYSPFWMKPDGAPTA